MLDQITPVILTFNEEPNIGRTLAQLGWARKIVVVDSFSNDQTLEIVKGFPQALVFQRKFDSHAAQWNFAISQTGIETPWILALDADYLVTEEAQSELQSLEPEAEVAGYTVSFRYCVWGEPLRGTLYPPVTALFRRANADYVQDGHTQRLRLDGVTRSLKARFLHDDRKPLSHWLLAQDRYMRLEVDNISGKPWSDLGFADRIRKVPLIAPFLVFANCYLLKGGILDGRAGLYYAFQRMLAETLLGLRILEHSSSQKRKPQDSLTKSDPKNV